MSRMEINALKALADAAEVGGYTLPAELTSALTAYSRTLEVTLPEPTPFNAEAAAARLVATLAKGDTMDPAYLVQEATDAQTMHVAVEHARTVVKLAVEQAADTATLLAADMADRIIADHLRPAFHQLLDETREVAAALNGHSLSLGALITAPAKVRNAYAKLPELAARHRLILEARKRANAIGHRTPKHDTEALFGTFEDAMALRPGWKAPARIPRVDAPSDPVEYLLWLVSPEAAPGKPWLPTVAEQDAAWWKQFGEAQTMRIQAHRNAHAVGARIGA